MAVFRKDPCGIICLIITYSAVLYADYVVVQWLILPTMAMSVSGYFHAVAFNLIVFLLITSHVRAVIADPGIVPLPAAAIDFSDMRFGVIPKNILSQDGENWSICQKCEAYRPPRAHHCRICQRCIRKMDHHCPWINNCVGEFNQKFFIQFLFYVGLAAVYSIVLIILCWTTTSSKHLKFPEHNAKVAHTIVLIVESILFGLFVCAIGCDQISAILEDETAVEQVKRNKGSRHQVEKSRTELLKEVFGRGSRLCWLCPFSTGRFPTITPPNFTQEV
ncbi:palmitoyltransferase ZDHHC3-like [Anneissia japonica]|uniref:palmitoyltransferase ZDHHC3-like n=1 Tax=Anneissia japonica TaxID=1529436 RepID=UPI0014256D1B|nr:palmitoyltransferase ZDHHC3-like [Anneissia japonica]XP_033119228.1 palmitoyltransferase ZDHHC3-like [Anneissia japonica]XP_033119233.1 palmitoyltransferase ZDHHC3-like [Anneissia japonica]